MHSLKKLIAERIATGLQRKSITTCSRWAEKYRVMSSPFPGPWSFKYHPWLKEMHDSTAEINIGQKAAQMGFTEWALNTAFFNIDIRATDCLYVLPAKTPDASDFSAARFDPALEMSPHLSKAFSDVKNVGHKRAGNANLYIRGSRSRAGLKSIPVGLIILDEVNEMEAENIPLALERAAGQISKQILMLSTPTIRLAGINKYYEDSTQEHFFFKCPSCSRFTELIFPESLEICGDRLTDPAIIQSYLKCKECKNKLHHETKTEWLVNSKWVPSFTDREPRGFHVSQLYSSTVKPAELVKSYFRAQRDPADEQEFFNSNLGLTHFVSGAAITDEDLDKCKKSYKNAILDRHSRSKIITMGVDVGKWLHIEIDEWQINHGVIDVNILSTPKLIYSGKVLSFEELYKLVIDWQVHMCVIDANPERRKAFEFASKFWGHVKLCFYARGINGKSITIDTEEEQTIKVDRTSWLDLSLGRFKRQAIELPFDISQEFREHLKALVRIYEKDGQGNPVGRYDKGNDDDHFAHARNYAEIALPLAIGISQSQNIANIL